MALAGFACVRWRSSRRRAPSRSSASSPPIACSGPCCAGERRAGAPGARRWSASRRSCRRRAVFVWYNRILHRWGVFAASPPTPPRTPSDLRSYGPLTLGSTSRASSAVPNISIVYSWPDSAIPLDGRRTPIAVAVVVALVAFVVWVGSPPSRSPVLRLAFLALMIPYLHIVERHRAGAPIATCTCRRSTSSQSSVQLAMSGSRAPAALARMSPAAPLRGRLSRRARHADDVAALPDNHALWS